MSLLRNRAPLAVTLAAVALSGALTPGMQYSLHAQEPTPAAPPAVPAAPTPPDGPSVPQATQIDPQARALLNQMAAAYKGLKSYAGTMDFTTSAPAGENSPPPQRTTIVIQKPNRVSIKTTVLDKSITVVSNGTNLFVATSREKDKYLKKALPTGQAALKMEQLLMIGGVDGPGLLPLLAGSDPLMPIARFMKSLSIAKEENVNGVAVDVVTADFEAGPVKGAVIFMIGKADHLLRRATVTQANGNKMIVITETHSNIKVDSLLAGNAFAFIPVKGAKAVDSLEPPTYDPRLKVGAVPFAFNAKDVMGKPVNLGVYKGRVVLLDFWATWCEPCIAEIPTLVGAYKKFSAKGFSILGISLDQAGQRNNLINFTKANKMPWRHIYEGKFWASPIAQKYKVQAIPFNLLIGRDGKIAAVNVHGAALSTAISKALAKKK